ARSGGEGWLAPGGFAEGRWAGGGHQAAPARGWRWRYITQIWVPISTRYRVICGQTRKWANGHPASAVVFRLGFDLGFALGQGLFLLLLLLSRRGGSRTQRWRLVSHIGLRIALGL